MPRNRHGFGNPLIRPMFREFTMSTFTPIRSFLLNRCILLQTWVVVCMAMVGCTSQQQTPTQEQKQQGQAQQEQNQPAQTQQVENQQVQDQDEEVQMGQEVFNQLKAKGEIIESSPLYDQLKPIVDPIARAAQPRYNHPFKFYLVHETQPNAFATPGGNVYVVDSLLYFVKNTDQLAGTLCDEVSHTIHHDTMTLMEKQEKLERREVGAAILLGPTRD